MSHIDQGPLPAYNSLADNHLAGYFTNTRMRRHLRKAGLVNKYGEIVTENTYRLNMSRREHKQHVKDMLAQAIVHKTLDLERTRQAEIRKKLEEIAKIELVRRVRADRKQTIDDALLPLLSPRPKTKRSASAPRSSSSKPPSSAHSPSRRRRRGEDRVREINGNISAVHERSSRYRKREADILPYISPRSSSSRPSSGPDVGLDDRKRGGRGVGRSRPISDPPRDRKRRPISALSSNYDEDDEGAVVYLDDEGRPITPAHVDESNLRYASKDPIDTRHLYSLDTAALRKYATLMAKMEQGRGGASPYLIPQVPLPPKSPKSPSRAASARRTPRSDQRYRGEQSKSISPKRPSTANQAYLHPASGVQKYKGQQETMCQVAMVYHGSSLSLAREMLPGRSKQDVVVEQQHCGGNTLTVFRDSLERGAKFSFISYRHRGYPFSLSIYIDGKMDCRVSTCCEYRHQKGGRIGGKKGHFSISGIQGAVPCYKCQVEKGIRVGTQAPRPKLKRPPEHQEEVVVVETAREPEPAKPQPEPAAPAAATEEQILVPVEDGDEHKADDKYDEDDFESGGSGSSSSAEEEDYAVRNVHAQERGGDGFSDDSQHGRHDSDTNRNSARERRVSSRKNVKKAKREESNRSDSSCCGEDESYYEYKQRMLRKAEVEDVSDRSGSSGSSRASSAKVKDKHRLRRDDRTYSASDHKDVDSSRAAKADRDAKADVKRREKAVTSKSKEPARPKKRSSTSSGPGQAEPVNRSAAEPDGDASARQAHRRGGAASGCGERGARAGRAHNPDRQRGPEAGDTADEVSDIESEMAASPRKAGLAGNACDLADGRVNGISGAPNDVHRNNSCHAKTIRMGDRNERDGDFHKQGINRFSEGKVILDHQTNETNRCETLGGSIDGDHDKSETGLKMQGKETEQSKNHEKSKLKGAKNADLGLTADRRPFMAEKLQSSSKVFPSWERVLDNAEGEEMGGLQLNLDPEEQSAQRGDMEFPLEDKKDQTAGEEGDSDSRGASHPHDPTQWAMYQSGKRVKASANRKHNKDDHAPAHSALRKDEEVEERATLRDEERSKARSKHSKNNAKKASRVSNVSVKQVMSSLGETNHFHHSVRDQPDKAEKVESSRNDGTSEHPRDEDASLKYEGKPLFSSKITSIPMAKTGENKYLNKQAAELAEAERRRKTESLTANLQDRSKRKGQYYKDLSPPEPVIRGFVGDSMSDNEDDDETYSRLGPIDDRANLSDVDRDAAGPKDYVLASTRDVSVAVSSTSAMSHNVSVKDGSHLAIEVVDHGSGNAAGQPKSGPTDVGKEGEDVTTYRVYLDEDDLATRKTSGLEELERLKKEEERIEQAWKQLDDVRGKAKRSGNAKTISSNTDKITQQQHHHPPDLHPSLREANSKRYRRDPESYYSPAYPRVDSEGSEIEAAGAAELPGALRHPQLKPAAPAHSDNLAFRHSFVEEPTPKIFRPGIDDKNMIQSQVSPSTAPNPQSANQFEVNCTENNNENDTGGLVFDDDYYKSKSFEDLHPNDKQGETDHGVDELNRKAAPDVVKLEKGKAHLYSSTEESGDTTGSQESFSESSNQAEMEIIGTRYLETEAARYARHHKAFDEAPVLDREFRVTGTTLSVLSPCDRSGLPVPVTAQNEDSAGRGETHILREGDHGDIAKHSENNGTSFSSDELKTREDKIPCLSVNTPGPEYDHEDIEFRRLQIEKKRLKMQKTEVIREMDNPSTPTHLSAKNEERVTDIDPQRPHSTSSPPGTEMRQPTNEGNMQVNAQSDIDGFGESRAPSAEKIKRDSKDLNCKEIEHPDDFKHENTTSSNNIKTCSAESATAVEINDDDTLPEVDDAFFREKARSATRSCSLTGSDLMDMYLGKRRTSGATADVLKQFSLDTMESVGEEAEPSANMVSGAELGLAGQHKSSAAEGKEDQAGGAEASAVGKVDTCSGEAESSLLPKPEYKKKNKKKERAGSRHRESVTASDLMELYLGGERAKHTREKMDQVMNQVSSDAESSYEHLPGLEMRANPDDTSKAARADQCEQDRSGLKIISSEAGAYDNVTAEEENSPEVTAVAVETPSARRDSSYHADDDVSETPSGAVDAAASSSVKVKRMTKRVRNVEEKAGLTSGTVSQVEGSVNFGVEPVSTEPKTDGREGQGASDKIIPPRKDSVPEVFIIAADGTKFVESLDEKDDSKPDFVVGDAVDVVKAQSIAGDKSSACKQNSATSSERQEDEVGSGASDVSSVSALIECLEDQLKGSEPLPASRAPDTDDKEFEANNHEEDERTISQNPPAHQEIDDLLSRAEAYEKSKAADVVEVLVETEEKGQNDAISSHVIDGLREIQTADSNSSLDENLASNYIPSFGIAADILNDEKAISSKTSQKEKKPSDLNEDHKPVETSASFSKPQVADGESVKSFDEDAETISGKDEDDAARRYVERILNSVNLFQSNGQISAVGMNGNTAAETDATKASLCSGAAVGSESRHYKVGTDGAQDANQKEGGRCGVTSDALPRVDLVAEYEAENGTGGPTSATTTTTTSNKSSSLQSPGSEHCERRRQRKLTVSFAVDESDSPADGDGGDEGEAGRDGCDGSSRSRARVVEVPWEAADEEEKEDEYERLERELEKSLKVH